MRYDARRVEFIRRRAAELACAAIVVAVMAIPSSVMVGVAALRSTDGPAWGLLVYAFALLGFLVGLAGILTAWDLMKVRSQISRGAHLAFNPTMEPRRNQSRFAAFVMPRLRSQSFDASMNVTAYDWLFDEKAAIRKGDKDGGEEYLP